jgi:pilus assembly protein Flp/PilA
MNKLIARIQAYMQSEEGATAIEYGLIAGGISLAIVAALFAFGDQLGETFGTMSEKMTEANERVQAGDAGATP